MATLLSQVIPLPELLKLIQQSLSAQPDSIPRDLLIRALELVVCNHDSRKYYLGLLNEIAAEKRLYTKNPLNDELVASILEGRFSEIENRILSEIAGSYYAISELAFEVAESAPEAWNPVFEELGKHILKDSGFPLQSNAGPTNALAPAAEDELKASDTTLTRPSFRHYFPVLAASLLAAVSISWSLWLSSRNASLRNSNALLTARVERQTESLQKAAALTKESFADTVANSAPLYLSGRTTPGLIRRALQATRTASRSAALTDDQLSDLERSRKLFEGAASLLKPEDRSTVIEDVTASIWSRNLDQAEELLQRTESSDNPAVINLKGVLAMYQSEYKENSEPNLKKEAESFFREAAGKGELIAWINLAILLELDGRTEEAVNALNSYIENAPADEAAVVRQFLPDTSK